MAIPKVFISSTCFDLSEIREQLSKFVSSFGFDPILSDHGDVFYHPDLHTHEACVHEVSNCQLFILIIGGRFGGQYLADKEKSITNAEYRAAKSSNIPVFTYIKEDVLSNHHIYSTNSKNDIADKINYPAIQKKEDAVNIFKFINEVRKESNNNGYEGFSNFSDIENHLRKQWAGMFFDFLKTREIKSQIDATNHLLENLKSSNKKLEDIVTNLYINTSEDKELAQFQIDEIELISKMSQFYNSLIDSNFIKHDFIEGNILNTINSNENIKTALEISKIDPKNNNWESYLKKTSIFKIEIEYEFEKKNKESFDTLIILAEYGFGKFLSPNEISVIKFIYSKYICKSSEEQRLNFFRYYLNSFNLGQT